MQETSIQTNSDATERIQHQQCEEPHFDDIAIAIAQPVAPLVASSSTRPSRFGVLTRHVSSTAIMILVAVIIGLATFGLVLASLHHQSQAGVSESTIKPLEPSSPDNAVDASIAPVHEGKRVRAKRTSMGTTRIQSKNAPRKVGTIFFDR